MGPTLDMKALVESAVAGDQEARAILLQRHLAGLRAFVRLRLGPRLRQRESSQDLVQSVCREALAGLHRFEYRGPDSFRNWLLREAENKIRDKGRFWGRARRTARREAGRVAAALAREREEELELASQLRTFCTPSRHASAREELLRAEAAFGRLPEDHRQVIVLVRLLGMPHAEAAAALGRTPAATRVLLCRALARLATLLEEQDRRDGAETE